MPSQISLLSLLINSESHRELLLKILIEAHVPQDITPVKFRGIINNITTSRHLSFSKEVVLVEGKKAIISPFILQSKVMGEITLPIRTGPTTFDITFQVMDIRPAYNFLLGRPWIHVGGVVPSSLHQKVKFTADGQLISVMGEK
ncbi:hypothetical protein CR513_05181, partial [Mucuna pruriens]